MKKTLALPALLCALASGAFSSTAQAAWPDDKPIELVVGFAPGGGTDVMARLLARYTEKRLGEKARIIVINKPGAGGELAAAFTENAKADGYTLGMINVPGYVFMPLYKKTAYQPEHIRLIARLVDDPLVLIAKRGSSVPPTLTAIVDTLKKKPASLSFGHSGDGTTGHIALMQLEEQQSVKATSVPFKGASEARLALLGGHIDYALITTGEVPDLDDPKSPVQALAQLSDKRGKNDVPTGVEQGFPVRMASERGIGAPGALPDDIAAKLEAAIGQTLRDPEFLAAAKNDAPVLAFLPGAQWTKSLEANRVALKPLAPRMVDR
ncbi:tripartite tricarboxylate transporter substrate binding protein [Xylophilus rhododendri]|uniref:Tripartite tricarboxylate transporter substrate binding protein n=1 Tax=Xylophilus rhododendri TaxID=2697032 RepID=A0A857J428_9BURK|nr:tripartite tricarboxylate transporter substrate binding protein [Xylophilus rhododendri]QHI97615.1 tripartite tricarboxylate transporter substrate binding protein [Xylophilus rhododendri]